MIAGKAARRPAGGRPHVQRIDRHLVFGEERFGRVAQRIGRHPIGERERSAPAAARLLGGKQVEPCRDPALERRGVGRRREVRALEARHASVRCVGQHRRRGIPLDAERPSHQPPRHRRSVAPGGKPRAGRDIGIAVKRGNGLPDVPIGLRGEARIVRVVDRVEPALVQVDALEEPQRRVRVPAVI